MRIGSMKVNQIRIFFAVIFLAATHLFYFKTVWTSVSGAQYGYLAMSGFVGLFLGDICYFASLVISGPKRAAVMMTISPAAAAVLAWVLIGESISVLETAGMLVTIIGIALTVSGRTGSSASVAPAGRVMFGVVLGILGGIGQGAGMVLAKIGLTTLDPAGAVVSEVNPLAGTLIRMTTASAMLWLMALGQEIRASAKTAPSPLRTALRDRKALLLALCGAALGPFLGVWSSLFAVKHVDVAVASTIMAAFPILVIPQMFIYFGEKPGVKEVLGAIAAVGGIAVMLLGPKLFVF